MAWRASNHRVRPGPIGGWEAALLELEHQAEHWDTPDHRETGHLIASALRAAVDIARSGGLCCEHRPGSLPAVELDASSGARDEAQGRRLPAVGATAMPPEALAHTVRA